MKKLNSSLCLLIVAVCSFVLMSNTSLTKSSYVSVTEGINFNPIRSNGSPGDKTGSPGDGGATCTDCHSPGANFNLTPTITTNIPLTGYVFGTTYNVQVTATSNGNEAGRGFELTAENNAGSSVGVYDLTGATGSPQIITSGGSVTHTNDLFNSWSFDWTAPLVDEGIITFYTAVNAVNGSGTSGDQVVTTTESVDSSTLSLSENNILAFDIYPNPTKDYITIHLPDGVMDGSIEIFDFLGRAVITTKINRIDNKLNLNNLTAGMYIINLTSEEKTGIKIFVKK